MSAEDAVRYLAYRAAECRDRDAHEALCLLLPPLLRSLDLSHMTDDEACRFRNDLREILSTGVPGPRPNVPYGTTVNETASGTVRRLLTLNLFK
jgi:hypothetical protein